MAGRRIAILIASSRFPHEPGLAPLSGPENDVSAMREVLAAPAAGGFTEATVLANEPAQNVRVALNQALRTAGRDDTVLIYYSGHGKLDYRGRLCLAMTDTRLEVLEATSVRVNDIKDFLDVSPCKQVALILDCCYSGAVGKAFTRGGVEEQLQVTAEGSGISILTASSESETAMEREQDGLGVFTRQMTDAIRSGEADQDGDGVITLDELYEYVAARVRQEGRQHPQKWNLQMQGRLVVAQSGAWKERREKTREKILSFATQRLLPDRIVSACIETLAVEKQALTQRQRRLVDLMDQIERGHLALGEFVGQAFDVIAASEEPARVAEPQPATVPVRPAVPAPPEPPPVAPAVTPRLSISPPGTIDLGRVRPGDATSQGIRISNAGSGDLDWSWEADGEFFSVRQSGNRLLVETVPSEPGSRRGQIRFQSNGGDAVVEVRARFLAEKPAATPASPPSTPQAPPPALIGHGRWLMEMSAYGIASSRFTLDLFPNGALQGMQEFMGIQAPITGNWAFDPVNAVLGINMVARLGWAQGADSIALRITGQQGDVLQGVDQAMRAYALRRVG
jgi:hypothetical protein